MKKWGDSIYLQPEYRRGYVEVLKALEVIGEEGTKNIPKNVMDFIQQNQDPNYEFEVRDIQNPLSGMTYEGFKVMEMIIRYFWDIEGGRQGYDQDLIDSTRKTLIKKQEYIQRRIDDYLKYDYCCQFEGYFFGDGTLPVFEGISPAKLREYPKGCTEVLAVLQTLIPNYVERIPKKYIWVMEMSKSKGYQYTFKLEEYDDRLYEENFLSNEALEILADISYRFWRGYQVSPEDIPVKLHMIEYE